MTPVWIRGVLALVVVVSCGGPVWAQTAVPGAPPDGADLRPGEIQRLFDAYLVMEAQQTLGLTDGQYGPFLTKLKALQETRRRYQAQRALVLVELARLSGPRAPRTDEAVLKERLTALQELESRAAAESRKAYAEVDALLDPRQQARFRVFEDQIERRKIELMLRARQNARQQRLQPRR